VALSYDRRAPERLIDVLAPGGWARSLVEYGRSGQYALDLQLRGYAGKPTHRATLYVGLTKVVDLHYHRDKGFCLDAHATYRQPKLGWRAQWEHHQSEDELTVEWPSVEDYLERVIPTLGSRYLKEGAVQSAISGFAGQDIVVIDREATIAFSSQNEKNAVTTRLSAPLLGAVEHSNGLAWWNAKPTSLGGECDALAVTRGGDLLAIEIKPAKATRGITWAPLQARHYANLFAEWAQHATDAVEVINGMLDQRVRLGLANDLAWRINQPIRVHPLIAIARGYSSAARTRLAEIHGRLVEVALNDPPLQAASVTLAGRLDAIELPHDAGGGLITPM